MEITSNILNENELSQINGGGGLMEGISTTLGLSLGSVQVAGGAASVGAGFLTANPALIIGGTSAFCDGILNITTSMPSKKKRK